jgi:hypothetical protein
MLPNFSFSFGGGFSSSVVNDIKGAVLWLGSAAVMCNYFHPYAVYLRVLGLAYLERLLL